MVEKTSDDNVRTGTVDREAGAEATREKGGQWRISEAGLAVVYLLSFAAVGLCGGSGQASVAAVGGVGLLVGILVCLLTAFRGQLLTSVLLMAVLMGLVVLTNPAAVAGVVDQVVIEYEDYHGGLIDGGG